MSDIIRHRRDLVAMEAFAVADVTGLLHKALPTIVSEFLNFSEKFQPGDQALALTSKQADFVRYVSKYPYGEITALGAFVPEGMSAKYLKYIDALEQAVKHATSAMDTVLAPYAGFLAGIVTNADLVRATARTDATYAGLEKTRDVINGDLGRCFTNGSHATSTTYGAVVARNNDWPAIFQRSDALFQAINRVDRKALSKKVKEISDLLEVLLGKLRRKELDEASSQMVLNLADGAYQAASELAFFSVTYYKTAALAAAINRTTAHVLESV